MFDTIIHWLNIVPLSEPWRAIVLVASVLGFTFILHILWDLALKLTGKLGRRTSRSKA